MEAERHGSAEGQLEVAERPEVEAELLAGSFTRPIDVRPGDEFRFDSGPLGDFELAFG